MKRKRIGLVMSVMLSFVTAFSGADAFADTNGGKDIVILYTNDAHCGVDDAIGYDGLTAYKKDMIAEGNDVLLVDNGDIIQGGTIGALSKGEALIDILNAVGYDLAIPGNHEFDYTVEQFFNIINQLNFPFLSCNFTDLRTNELLLEPYEIKEIGGKKIAFIGATTPQTIKSSTPRYFQDENGEYIYSFLTGNNGQDLYDAIQTAVDSAHKENADYCILMSHLGLEESAEPYRSTDVIANTTGIDVVLDGHSHSTVEKELVKNRDGEEVILTQTGTKLNAIGKLTLDENGFDTELIKDYDKKDAAVSKIIEEKKAANEKILNKAEGHTDFDLVATASDNTTWLVRSEETNLGDFAADAYKYASGADIAIANGGGLRKSIPAGDITFETLMNVHPSGNELVMKGIKGSDLRDALEFSVSFAPSQSGGFPQVSGITFDLDLDKKADIEMDDNGFFVKINEGSPRRLSNLKVNGEDFDDNKYYKVIGNDYIMLYNGSGNTGYKGEEIKLDAPLKDIDALEMYLESMGGKMDSRYADPKGEGRIVISGTGENAKAEATAEPTKTEFKFTDIDSHWAKNAIEKAADKGIVAGFDDGTFKPDINVTRGQLVSVLYRMENEPKTGNTNKFADVKDSAYYTNAVIWANGENIVSGIDDTHFAPDSDITREQLALILFHYKNIEDQGGAMGLAGYTDSDEISDWARPAMLWAVKSGIISGMGDGALNPKGSATRAQIASIITRLDSEESTETADNPIGFKFSEGVKPITWEPSADNLIIQTDEARELFERIQADDYPTIEELKASRVVAQLDELAEYYIQLYGITADIDTPEREQLREDIAAEFLSTGSARTRSIDIQTGKHSYAYDGELRKDYQVEIVTGLPAAGKSSKIVDPDSEEMKAFILDNDMIKELIPEFKESHGAAADAVHKESGLIRAMVIKELTEGDMQGTNVIIPVIGESLDKLMSNYIKPFEDAGYNVKVKYLDVDTQTSMARNVARELKSGRIINSSVVFGYGSKPKEVFAELAPMINSKGEPYGYDTEDMKRAA